MKIRHGIRGIVLLLAGVILGKWASSPSSGSFTMPSTAAAAEALAQVEDGKAFVSTDGGVAYLWRRVGDRIELIGQCQRVEGGDPGQAGYVWLPGVERRS